MPWAEKPLPLTSVELEPCLTYLGILSVLSRESSEEFCPLRGRGKRVPGGMEASVSLVCRLEMWLLEGAM